MTTTNLPPTGTITFLFTDIEGSTALWERYPDAMTAALARHDAILRETIDAANGFLVKSRGDGAHATFHTAADALRAALAAQRALQAEDWPTPIVLRVRMGLHTGAAEYRDGDYFGSALNRAVRLTASSWGGQTLLTEATHELCRDGIPPLVGLRNLGEHRLKDLARSERIFQLTHPALQADFPPLRTLDNISNNLPQQATSFIGRERELAEIAEFLGKGRLVTLTGAGGSGKTRLALQIAADRLDDFPDGAWLVEFAPLADPALVAPTVAQALGIKEQAGQTVEQTLTEYLKSRHLLLILDNCEHLLTACASLAAQILRSCFNVKLLATSREPLRIGGEVIYRVPPLALPDPKVTYPIEALSQYEAVRLFIERARTVKPDFAVTNGNAPALAEVCCRLDGIPLAIELAAARIRSLTVEDVYRRLDDRFRLLTGGDRAALPRQQTLRALIDWSYDLLAEPEKTLFARLATFAGGWTLAAAESVGGFAPLEEGEALDLLTSLADKSLILANESGGSIRYEMLESLRQYAAEKRDERGERGEAATLRQRHQAWCLSLAEAAEPHLRGADQGAWLSRLEVEHDNFRAALQESVEDADSPSLRLAGLLSYFWLVRGYFAEGRERLAKVLDDGGEADAAPDAARAKALMGAGSLAYSQADYIAAQLLYQKALPIFCSVSDKPNTAATLANLGSIASNQGNYAAARGLYEEGLAVRRELGDQRGVALILANLGLLDANQGDYPTAMSLLEECLALFREMGDRRGIASALATLGTCPYELGDYPKARTLFEESLAIRRELGEKSGIATALGNLANVAAQLGDKGVAQSLHEESLALRREMGDQRGIVYTLGDLGNAALDRGDHAAARALYTESLTLRQKIGDKRGIAISLQAMGRLALAEADPRRATVLWGAADALRAHINAPRPPNQEADYAALVAQARAALGDAAFTLATNEGSALTLEQAIEYALLKSAA